MAAAATQVLGGITLASGTATFLMFIHEETAQTAMMAIFVADKNRLHDQAKRLIKRAAKEYVMKGVEYTRDWGFLAPYADGAFMLYFDSTADMLETYAKKYKVNIEGDLTRIRSITSAPRLPIPIEAIEDIGPKTVVDYEEQLTAKKYDCEVLAYMEQTKKEPKDAEEVKLFAMLGRMRQLAFGEWDKNTKSMTQKGLDQCGRRQTLHLEGKLTVR